MDVLNEAEQALSIFYDPRTPPQQIAQIEKWLLSVQHSPDGWRLPWFLLDPSKSAAAQVYGGLALVMKLTTGLASLTPDEQEQIRLQTLAAGSAWLHQPAVFAHIAVALAVCSKLVNWVNPVQDIINEFIDEAKHGNLPMQRRLAAAIDVLSVIAQEASRVLDPIVGKSMRTKLRAVADSTVQPLIQQCLQQGDDVLKEKALTCLVSWTTDDLLTMDKLWTASEHTSSLGSLVYACLVSSVTESRQDLFAPACRALEALTGHAETIANATLCHTEIIPLLLTLQEVVMQSLQNEDFDSLVDLCGIVTNFFLHGADSVVKCGEHHANAAALVNLLLVFTDMPGEYFVDERCSDLTFDSWIAICDSSSNAKTAIADEKLQASGVNLYLDVLLQAASVIIRKLVLPAELRERPIGEQRDQDDLAQAFYAYRQDAGDVLLQLSGHLEEPFVALLCGTLAQAVNENNWPAAEAALYAMRMVGDGIPPTEDRHIAGTLSVLTAAAQMHPRTNRQSLRVIGALASWISQHQQFISPAIQVCISGMAAEPRAACAAMEEVLDFCAESLSEDVETTNALVAAVAQHVLTLPSQDGQAVMRGVGAVIGYLPREQCCALVTALSRGPATELPRLLSTYAHIDSNDERFVGVCLALERCAKLLHAILWNCAPESDVNKTKHPCTIIIMQSWEDVRAVLASTFSTHDEMATSLWDLVGFAVRGGGQEVGVLLPSILETAYLFARDHLKPNAVNTTTTLIGEFAAVPAHQSTVAEAVNNNMSLFLAHPVHDPELSQAFVNLLCKLVRHAPALLFNSCAYLIEPLAGVITTLLLAPEHPTAKSTMNFVRDIIGVRTLDPGAMAMVNRWGAQWLGLLILGLAGDASRALTMIIIDALHTFAIADLGMFRIWLEQQLAIEGFPRPHITMARKQQLAVQLIRDAGKKNNFRDALTTFGEECRRTVR